MTDLAGLSTAAASAQSTANTARASLGTNFETFLQLLTAQIQNQDPLSPMDTNQFTEQLVQFSQVEQQIQMNEQLGSLVSVSRTSHTSSALGYLGRSVQVESNTLAVGASGGGSWDLVFPEPAQQATARVLDAGGRVVFETQLGATSGQRSFAWDGVASNGRAAQAGVYRLSIEARGAEDARVTPRVYVNETITGVSFDANGAPEFVTPGGVRSIDAIRMIRADG
jgi:flagellar basal-body rod modification protein FlgD